MEYKPERVVVQAQTDRAGYLILTDTFYPGWEAQLDGQPVPILGADYMFRTIALPPGNHSIVFEFRPPLLAWGVLVSAVSALLCIILLGGGFRTA